MKISVEFYQITIRGQVVLVGIILLLIFQFIHQRISSQKIELPSFF